MTDKKTADRVRKSRRGQGMTLAHYVHRRNGVPLGAPGSLQNMFYRSLSAGSFAEFWQYWNPIWGYALGYYVYAPLRRIFPSAIALILTFAVSGGIHDGVATLVRRSVIFLFTPWFLLMGIGVVVGQILHIDYTRRSWGSRVVINLIYIGGSLFITRLAF